MSDPSTATNPSQQSSTAGTQGSTPNDQGKSNNVPDDPTGANNPPQATTPDPTSQTQAGDSGNEPEGGDGRSIEALPKWAQKVITDTRSEAAKYRTQLREEQEKERKAQLSEEERVREEAAEAARQEERTRFEKVLIDQQARAALAQNHIMNPDHTVKLLDLSDVEVDDDGNVKGLSAKVEALKKDFPALVEGGSTNPNLGDRGGNTPAKPTMNDAIRRAAGRA